MRIKKMVEVEIEVIENAVEYCSVHPWCRFLNNNGIGGCILYGSTKGKPNFWERCQQCLDEFWEG